MLEQIPLGKLPPDLLKQVFQSFPIFDNRVVQGPGIGMDCAIIDNGANYLVLKTDPITFVSDQIGWYAVQIVVNDLVTSGAVPKWILATLLLPEGKTTTDSLFEISNQFAATCKQFNISIIGGHTEITYNLDRPIFVSTLIGEVNKNEFISPKGSQPGNDILVTKEIPIETIAILARQLPQKLESFLSPEDMETAKNYLFHPGISVYDDAKIAINAGTVTAMHDPTEGGIASALWELAEASNKTLQINSELIPISAFAKQICTQLSINPLESIASGSLLLTTDPKDTRKIILSLAEKNIPCRKIGAVMPGKPLVIDTCTNSILPLPMQDQITGFFDNNIQES